MIASDQFYKNVYIFFVLITELPAIVTVCGVSIVPHRFRCEETKNTD